MATNQHNKKTTCGQTHTHTPAHTQMHMQARTHANFKCTTKTWRGYRTLSQTLMKVWNKWEDELTVTRAESHVAWIQGFIKATEYRLQPGGREEERTHKYNCNTQHKTVFIDNIMTKQMHTPRGLHTRGPLCWDSNEAVKPLKSAATCG